jgi:hypothetical protein
MNCPPHPDQPLALPPHLLHHTAQIASTDADNPIKPDSCRSFQDDLRFAALSEHVHVGRTMIVRKDHKPEAISTVNVTITVTYHGWVFKVAGEPDRSKLSRGRVNSIVCQRGRRA